MDKFRFVLDRAGVRELMKSQAVTEVCQGYASAALGRLGEGYSSNTRSGKNRVNVEVRADTFKARRDNNQNNTILKAVMGC